MQSLPYMIIGRIQIVLLKYKKEFIRLGKVGRSYWIEILTSNRIKYESTPELIKNLVTIKSIYGETDKILHNNDTIF